jgi:hypothetical protein
VGKAGRVDMEDRVDTPILRPIETGMEVAEDTVAVAGKETAERRHNLRCSKNKDSFGKCTWLFLRQLLLFSSRYHCWMPARPTATERPEAKRAVVLSWLPKRPRPAVLQALQALGPTSLSARLPANPVLFPRTPQMDRHPGPRALAPGLRALRPRRVLP